MADLSTLDATAPLGSEAVSGGDDAIRATRDAVKTSFGGTDSGTGTQAAEHYLKGFHKFPVGATAARPTAGNAGRLYFNTDYTRIERDTGSAWAMVNAVQLATHTGSSTTVTTSWTNLATETLANVPAGGRLVAYCGVWLLAASTATYGHVRLRYGAGATASSLMAPYWGISGSEYSGLGWVTSNGVWVTALATASAASSDRYTIDVDAKIYDPVSATGYASLIVLVV